MLNEINRTSFIEVQFFVWDRILRFFGDGSIYESGKQDAGAGGGTAET